jgi:DHA2 family multidrug resistance protein
MGLYGLGVSFGPALGPVLGGYVTEYLNRRMVFFVNVPVGVLCMLLVVLVLPNVRDVVRQALDLAGLLAMTVFLISLLCALSQGHRHGWDTPYIQRLFVIAGVAFVVFLLRSVPWWTLKRWHCCTVIWSNRQPLLPIRIAFCSWCR